MGGCGSSVYCDYFYFRMDLSMVKPLTSVGRSGLSNWLLQRISALIMSAYLVFIVAYFFVNPSPSYEQWQGLHSSLAMRIFSLLTILSIAAHASLGVVWTLDILWGI